MKSIYYKLDNLQSMAFDIGNKINRQNEKISHLDQFTDSTINKVQSTDKLGRNFINAKSNNSAISLLITAKDKVATESKSLKSLFRRD